MGRLIRRLAGGLCAVLLAVSCATAPPSPPEPRLPPAETPRVEPASPVPAEPPAEAEAEPKARQAPLSMPVPQPVSTALEFPVAPPLDLEAWPFGWVDDQEQSRRLGLSERFWSDRKPLWRQALDARTPPSNAARQLQAVFRAGGSTEEAYRAAWHLWLVYREAALPADARAWLDSAEALRPGPVTSLERAWDQLFRLGDAWGARGLWAALPNSWVGDDARKARLLRQRLFLGTQSLSPAGADGYVSTLAVDRDDVWAGTWNGAVVRWSLSTGALDLILAPGPTVAPIKLLKVTGWFVYAFQDQSLLRYSKVTGTWRTFAYPAGWTGLRAQAAVADGQESLWVAYLGQGLWHWDRGEWTLVDDGGGGPFLNALASDENGGFWIGTKDRGLWSWKGGVWSSVPGPSNISLIEPSPDGSRWAVGTWGEGTWVLEQGRLTPESRGNEYVVGAAWSGTDLVWGTLDEGLILSGGTAASVGPLDGLPPGGISALVTWGGRWIWGTTGQGLGWWSEHENPALLR